MPTATIYYCGRTDDMFKVSGMWVSPFDVEAALVSHEAVLEAAVIGKEDADGLIKPKAFIVLRNGYKADDGLLETLKLHVKDKAGPWKFPRWIEARDGAAAHGHRQDPALQAARGRARRGAVTFSTVIPGRERPTSSAHSRESGNPERNIRPELFVLDPRLRGDERWMGSRPVGHPW